MEVYESGRKHGVHDADIHHAVEHAMVVADGEDDKVLRLGPDRAGNLLEIVSVLRADDTEIVIHAMAMRHMYDWLLEQMRDTDG